MAPCCAAEMAYTECLMLDKKVELLAAAASSGGADVAAALAAYSLAVPAMPPTEAVLRALPPSGDFPGAQFRLAGDRCGCFFGAVFFMTAMASRGGISKVNSFGSPSAYSTKRAAFAYLWTESWSCNSLPFVIPKCMMRRCLVTGVPLAGMYS